MEDDQENIEGNGKGLGRNLETGGECQESTEDVGMDQNDCDEREGFESHPFGVIGSESFYLQRIIVEDILDQLNQGREQGEGRNQQEDREVQEGMLALVDDEEVEIEQIEEKKDHVD